MELAPPPAPGSRVQELGDRLTVHFRPRRSWGEIAFLSFWLAGWTVGGLAAVSALADADWGARAFLLFWLGGWVFGECAVTLFIAWQLFGRELLTVTPEHLEVRREIGRFAQTKRYDVALVRDVRAARVPSDEDEPPRRDSCLEIAYRDDSVRVGEGMGEQEAEYVAATVMSRVRPRRSWGAYEQAAPLAEHVPEPAAEMSRPRRRRLVAAASLAFPLLVGAALALALLERGEAPPRTSPQPTAARERLSDPPSARDFTKPQDYAAAMTVFSLASGGAKVYGRPNCPDFATRRAWSCTVTADLPYGPLPGRAVRYRCFPIWGQPSAPRGVPVMSCGVESPSSLDETG